LGDIDVEIVKFGLKFFKIGVTPTPKFYIFGKLWRRATRPKLFVGQTSETKKLRFLKLRLIG